jgi:hypothetical protein
MFEKQKTLTASRRTTVTGGRKSATFAYVKVQEQDD